MNGSCTISHALQAVVNPVPIYQGQEDPHHPFVLIHAHAS